MRKVVAFAGECPYEKEVLSQFDDVEFITVAAKTEEEIIANARDAEVVLFGSSRMTENVIHSLEKCKLMIRYGIGYDTVDTVAAAKRGIFVCNSPNYGVLDVAEHALSLILAVSKKIVPMHKRVEAGLWGAGKGVKGVRLAGKTIGIVGFGNIGKALCKMAVGLSMDPVVYDPFVTEEAAAAHGARKVELDELLAIADVVSLHLPLNEKTHHMFDKALLSKMKPGAILVNTSRGPIVNEKELVDALEEGIIAGVGLDVFEHEKSELDKRLITSDRAVLTPHVAWNTDIASTAVHEEVCDNVVRYLKGERPHSIVNGL